MDRNLFVFLRHQRRIGWMLLVFLLLLPGLRASGDTFVYDGLTVTTDGVEGTDYQKEDRSFRILTNKDFTFSATSTVVRIVVDEGVQNAHFTLSGYNCDRGYGWIGGPIIIGKNSSATITLAEGTTNTIKGSYETETMMINDGASVIFDGTGSLTATSSRNVSAGHGAAIQLNKTATLTINSGTINAISEACSDGEGAAIGGRQYGDVENCGTLIINGGTVTLTANNAAAFGGGSGCNYSTVRNPAGRPGGTLIMNGGKLIANGRIGGGTSLNGTNYEGGAGGSITINGGEVTSTMDLGSASNATSSGSIKLVGGTLSTPSVTMADGKVSITQSTTLTDNFITTLPVTIADNVVLSVNGGGNLNIKKKNLTLGNDASVSYANAPALTDEYYEISTAAQLRWFHDLVNGGLVGIDQNLNANAKLMADIDLNNEPWTPMAYYTPWYDGPGQVYGGNFDGNYHTISNLNVQEGYECGLFGRVQNVRAVTNLGIINATVQKGEGDAGVIAGTVFHGSIVNCWTDGDIVIKENTRFPTGLGGIANLAEYGSLNNCHTSYSAVAGTISINNAGTDNCTAGIPSDAYKTGELAYLLNTNKATDETCSWGQAIGTDSHPVALVDGTNNVYQHGKVQEAKDLTLGTSDATDRMTTLCFPQDVTLPENVVAFTVAGLDASDITISQPIESTVAANTPVILLNTGTTNATVSLPATNGIFSNSETASTTITTGGNVLTGTYSDLTTLDAALYYFENSSFSHAPTNLPSAYQCYVEYASGADTYTPAIAQYLSYPTQNSDNYYEIYNAAQLKWFRNLVNGTLTDGTTGNNYAKGKLMADIDLNNEAWTPIGANCTLDGVSIPAFYGSFDGNDYAISNLNIENGTYRGFIGYAARGPIKNLGIVNAAANSGQYVGVIAGFASNIQIEGFNIQGCWTGGELNLSADDGGLVAGIVNAEYNCTATNCHTSYSTAVNETTGNGGNTITNCTANTSSDAYKTGELAYLLNSNKVDGETGWGQTIGTDAHPVALIDGTNNVYQFGTAQGATTLEIKVDSRGNRVTTLCFPKDITLPQGVMAFTVTGTDESSTNQYNGNVIMSKLETSVLPANTPVVLMNTGVETAKVQLPSVSCTYSNNASESTIVSQEGNLLKGTYSQKSLTSTQYGYRYYAFEKGATISAYQCYLDIENGPKYDYFYETSEPIGDIEYAVLSEEDKTCYVSRLFYAGIGTSNYEVTIPSTTQIEGTEYKVVQLGLCTDDDADGKSFANMNGNYNTILYVNLPKTIKTVSKQTLNLLGYADMMGGGTLVRFTTEEAPEFKQSKTDYKYYYASIEVPYAADNVYKSAWGTDYIYTTSRKTELDIANGEIEVAGDTYTQGETTNTINGTLVIKGTSNTNYVLINNGGTEDEPLRIAINGLSIDQSEVGDAELPAMNLRGSANVSLIVQGENTFMNTSGVPSIDIADGGSFAINYLSTGTLNYSSISGDAVTVAAKVYSGSNDYTTQDVKKNTELDTDKNQLAFSDYSVVTGVDNLVANGTCSKLILNDAIDVYSPSAFTANEVVYKRAFSDNDFNSLYLPFSASVDDFKDCEFYVINMFHQSDTDGDGILDAVSLEVSRIPSGSTLLANHPYLFKYTGTNLTDVEEFNLENISVSATETATFECSSMSYKYEFTGSFQGKTADEYAEYYVLGVDEATGKTVLAHPSADLPAMRWAMKMTARESQYGSTAAQAPAKVNVFVTGEDQTTGISSIGADGTDTGIYGVNGVRKSRMTEGINIVRKADGNVVKVLKR